MEKDIDIEQSTQIAALTKDIELLRGEVAKYKDKEHEQFNDRISKLEKWVWVSSLLLSLYLFSFSFHYQSRDLQA